ncbi:MAG: lamin tail domain-containing protein, partial [Patescibacteria group bacterium]
MTFTGYKKVGVSFAAILLSVPLFSLAANINDVVITEIAYDLKGADDGYEWVEIQNLTVAEIDLTGWKFSDGSNHILNAPPEKGGHGSLIVPAGGYAVLADDAAVFLSDHPSFSGTVIDTVMSLNNTAATLAILDKDGATINSVSYQKEWGGNGNGMMLQKIAGNWKESTQEGGTPGTANSILPLTDENATSTESLLLPSQTPTGTPASPSLIAEAGDGIVAVMGEDVFFDGSKSQGNGELTFLWNFGDGATKEGKQVLHKYLFPGDYIVTLKISNGAESAEDQLRAEIYSDSIVISEFTPNASDENGDWIELANQSSHGADISGWGLSTKEAKPDFKIPSSTFLTGNGFLALSKIIIGISLPDDSGAVYLFYPNGQTAGKVEYKNAPRDNSAALVAGGQYEWSSEQTPGAKNISISSIIPENDNESAQVSDIKISASQATNKSLFVEYKKRNGVKSFIIEPAFAYEVGAPAAVFQSGGNDNFSGAALSYSAFSRLWPEIISVFAAAVGLFWLFKKFKKHNGKH